jgi:hypothetical protein
MHVLATWLSGPFLAACVLLTWAGAVKFARPDDTRAAARAIGAPSSKHAVRLLAAIELAAGFVGAAIGSVGALFVAMVYLGLTLSSARLLRRAPEVPCACFGASRAPVSAAHVAVNAGATVIALSAIAGGSPLAVMFSLPFAGVLFLVLVGCAARLTWLLLALRPAVVGGR